MGLLAVLPGGIASALSEHSVSLMTAKWPNQGSDAVGLFI
jgi:hypothetical protein